MPARRCPGSRAGTTSASRATRTASTTRPASSWPHGGGCHARCSGSPRSPPSLPRSRSSARGGARPDLRPWLVSGALFGFGLLVCLDIHWMNPNGAAVFGWPLVWGLVMLPYRIVFGLTPAVAWDFGFALSLVFVALTVPAVAYLGRNATGRRSLGLAAARLLDGVAAPRRPDRRPRRLGEQPVGRRRRPPPLRRAALDAPRHRRRGARALAARDADAARARGLRTERRNLGQGLERAARRGGRSRSSSCAAARRETLAVSRRSARVRARRARLLAALVPEALRRPEVLADRPVRPGPRRLELDALVDLHAAHAGDRRAARRDRRLRAACARGRSRSCSPSCS